MMLQNLSDFDLSRSLKLKNVIGLSIYGFLLIYTVTMSIYHGLALIST